MVTAVSGFIEQVGSMIKEIPKHNYHSSTPEEGGRDHVIATID